jgi:hypothetical protein
MKEQQNKTRKSTFPLSENRSGPNEASSFTGPTKASPKVPTSITKSDDDLQMSSKTSSRASFSSSSGAIEDDSRSSGVTSPFAAKGNSSFSPAKKGSATSTTKTSPFAPKGSKQGAASTSPFGKTGVSSFSQPNTGASGLTAKSSPFATKGAGIDDAKESPMDSTTKTSPFAPKGSKQGTASTSPFGTTGVSSFSQSNTGASSPPAKSSPFATKGAGIDDVKESPMDSTTKTTPFAPKGSKQGTASTSPFGTTGVSSFSQSKSSASGPPAKSSPFATKGAGIDDVKESPGDSTSSTTTFPKFGSKQGAASTSPFGKTGVSSFSQQKTGAFGRETKSSPFAPTTSAKGSMYESEEGVKETLSTSTSGNTSFPKLDSQETPGSPQYEMETSPTDSSSPGWYNAPVELDWGQEDTMLPESGPPNEPANKPNAIVNPNQQRAAVVREQQQSAQSQHWDPHGAVASSTVDLMTTYSSSNGEWWAPARTTYETMENGQNSQTGLPGRSPSGVVNEGNTSRDMETDSMMSSSSTDSNDAASPAKSLTNKIPAAQPDETTVDLMTTYSSNSGEWWAPARTTYETMENDKNSQTGSSSFGLPGSSPSGVRGTRSDVGTNSIMPASATDSNDEAIPIELPTNDISAEQQDETTADSEPLDSSLADWDSAPGRSRDTEQQDEITGVDPQMGGTPSNWYNKPVDMNFFGSDQN